ncbi:MAG: hypothetical protein AAB600_01995 [Patescibacteria group bacterium]
MKNNQLVVGSFIIIALSIAYYLLLYLPKQQEISLRKQVYEVCLKETDSSELLNNQADVLMGQYGKEDGITKWGVIRDTWVNNCVEKRLQEYNK